MKLFDKNTETNEAATAGADVSQPFEATREDNAMESKITTSQSDKLKAEHASQDNALSVVGQSLIIKGEIEAAEDMLIEGRVEGSIHHTAEHLTVGPSGTVNADIDARNLIVQGVVEGNIVGSESVVITDSAHVTGNIYTPRISIADGAQFSGTVDMELANKTKH